MKIRTGPIMAWGIGLLAVFGSAMAVAACLTALAVGTNSLYPVFRLDDPGSQALLGVFGGLSLLILVISLFASTSMLRRSQYDSNVSSTHLLIPIFTVLGFAFGGWAGYSLQGFYEGRQLGFAETSCKAAVDSITEDEMDACMGSYPECKKLVDSSPCDDPDSVELSAACLDEGKTAREKLRSNGKFERLNESSPTENLLLYGCLVDRTITPQSVTP